MTASESVMARLNKNTGHSSSVLVRSGKLQPGDVIVAGTAWARVRAMNNDLGASVKACMPGVVVETTGWKNAPQVSWLCLTMKLNKPTCDRLEIWFCKSKTKHEPSKSLRVGWSDKKPCDNMQWQLLQSV